MGARGAGPTQSPGWQLGLGTHSAWTGQGAWMQVTGTASQWVSGAQRTVRQGSTTSGTQAGTGRQGARMHWICWSSQWLPAAQLVDSQGEGPVT